MTDENIYYNVLRKQQNNNEKKEFGKRRRLYQPFNIRCTIFFCNENSKNRFK